jgi:inner membrane protein
MDLITQALLGAAIGEAGWGKKLGPTAARAGALLGMLPDADVVAAIGGQWASMLHHRGITHSLFWAPVMCLPIGYLAMRLSRHEHQRVSTWAHLAFWAMWTHPMLDVFTAYGTQLLVPFSRQRFAIDGVAIIDPAYTFPLAAALLLARFTRSRRPNLGPIACAITLALTTAYLGFGTLQAHKARQIARQELERQDHPHIARVRALPTMGNIWLWRLIAQDSRGDMFIGQHSHIAPTPVTFTHITIPESPLIHTVKQSERGQLFHWFADDWVSYSIHEDPDPALPTRVTMLDVRYGGIRDPSMPLWGAHAYFNADGDLSHIDRFQQRGDLDVRAELAAIWRKIWSGADTP